MTREDIERAIESIKKCRETHVQWADAIRQHADHPQIIEQQKVAGDLEHHTKWVAEYDHVLHVLNGLTAAAWRVL